MYEYAYVVAAAAETETAARFCYWALIQQR
jgi:hypothetical protein